MAETGEGTLADWLAALEGDVIPASGDRSVALPGIVQACTLEVLLGKLYTSTVPAASDEALHTWATDVTDPSGLQASYAVEVYRQPGAGKFKYAVRFRACKGKILLVQGVKACVNSVRPKGHSKGQNENILLTRQPDAPLDFYFSTNVHCRRELDLSVSFLLLLKAEPAANSPLEYSPPSIDTLYNKRPETGDLTLIAVDPDGTTKTSMPVHSAVLKLCCAYFATALGDSWKKGSDVELPVLTNQEAAEILVTFLYLGKPGTARHLSSIEQFATAEQLYLLGDALGIDPLRRMVGARIEMPDLAQWAVASQLKYHEHFAADHLDNVVDVVRMQLMKEAARADLEYLSERVQSSLQRNPPRKRSGDEMMDAENDSEASPDQPPSKQARMEES